MATIKSYTDLEQSKVLATILPIESADMKFYYNHMICEYEERPHVGSRNYDECSAIPAWSLAALLGVLLEIQYGKPIIALDDNYITYPHMSDLHTKADNLVDACVAMIEKLNELKIL